MKFSALKTSHNISSRIFLMSKYEEISDLGLSEEEYKYVKTKTEGKETKIARINRYTESIFIIKISPSGKDKTRLSEDCRIAGSKILPMLKSDNTETASIHSLSKSLSVVDLAEGLALSSYQFLKYFSDADKRKLKLREILLANASKEDITFLESVVAGVFKARDLINEPLMYLTAEQLAREAQKAGEEYGFKVETLNKKKIESLKMGGLLAVNKGSIDPPTFTIMEYSPEKAVNKKPVVLVGKGVVYDTGGLSLKPTPGSMDSMKSDMSGAAAVIGTMIAIAKSALPVHVIGLVPATDNRPGQNAYTPGDIIKMFDGSTVEVLNTDAEGRMLLADALSYAKKYKPQLTIDLATLTGAAAVAIGKYGIVGMGNASEEEFRKITHSGEEVYERIVRFPFWDEYNELLKSSVADVKNIGGREGGAITAGKFLERFTDYPYIHLDIAGPAFLNSDHDYRLQGGTGVGVRLMYNYLKNLK